MAHGIHVISILKVEAYFHQICVQAIILATVNFHLKQQKNNNKITYQHASRSFKVNKP